MAVASDGPEWDWRRKPSGVTLLRAFCAVAALVYADRGAMSSAAVSGTPKTDEDGVGSGMQGGLGCGYAEYGALTAAFMIGLLVGSPCFAAMARRVRPFTLIGIGLGGYALGELGCALAPTYGAMFAARCVVGLGEASFVALAAPFIDDLAPAGRKTLWLAMFYACVPLGVALGIALGGVIAPTLGWRWAFGLNACAAFPAAALCFFAPNIAMRGLDEAVEDVNERGRALAEPKSAFRVLTKDLKELFASDVYVCTALAYASYTAVIGVYAVWGPKAGYAIFKEFLRTSTRADMILGGVTVVSGITGTLLGGYVVDSRGSSLATALRTSALAALVGFVFLEIAFVCNSFAVFIVLLLIGQTFAFALQAPVNAVVLWSVAPRLRPLACSMTTVIIHVLGDVPTPPIFGHVLEQNGEPTPRRWRDVCSAFTLLFVAAALGLHAASRLAMRAVDHRRVGGSDDGERDDTDTDTESIAPTALTVDDVRDRLLRS